jgi:thymidylate synthase
MNMNTMDTVWAHLLGDVIFEGAAVWPRGLRTWEILQSTIMVDATRPIVTIPARNLGYRFMAAEAAWILSGDNKLSSILPYSAKMKEFSDDGQVLFGAYGPKLHDQLMHVVSTLIADHSSRQAVINIWRENPPATKDYPCTLSCQFMIRDGKLNVHVTMRSSDIWLGVPYDVFSMAMVGAAVAMEVDRNLVLGHVYQTAASRHIYAGDVDGAKACLAEPSPGFDYEPLDLSEFVDRHDLVDHLWAVARCQPTSHRWLKELPA